MLSQVEILSLEHYLGLAFQSALKSRCHVVVYQESNESDFAGLVGERGEAELCPGLSCSGISSALWPILGLKQLSRENQAETFLRARLVWGDDNPRKLNIIIAIDAGFLSLMPKLSMEELEAESPLKRSFAHHLQLHLHVRSSVALARTGRFFLFESATGKLFSARLDNNENTLHFMLEQEMESTSTVQLDLSLGSLKMSLAELLSLRPGQLISLPGIDELSGEVKLADATVAEVSLQMDGKELSLVVKKLKLEEGPKAA